MRKKSHRGMVENQDILIRAVFEAVSAGDDAHSGKAQLLIKMDGGGVCAYHRVKRSREIHTSRRGGGNRAPSPADSGAAAARI